MSKQSPKPLTLSFKRVIDASPKEVYDVWIHGKTPGPPWHGAEASIFHRVKNGLYYFLHKNGREEYPHYGRFLALQRGKLVKQTWMSPFTHGRESIVTLSLKPAPGGKTALSLRHEKLTDDDKGRLHDGGWVSCLDALGANFMKGKKKSK